MQELQSRLDAELDARDRISQSSQSVQSKITQYEKQVWELTEQLRVETDAHTKDKKLLSDLQKVCLICSRWCLIHDLHEGDMWLQLPESSTFSLSYVD